MSDLPAPWKAEVGRVYQSGGVARADAAAGVVSMSSVSGLGVSDLRIKAKVDISAGNGAHADLVFGFQDPLNTYICSAVSAGGAYYVSVYFRYGGAEWRQIDSALAPASFSGKGTLRCEVARSQVFVFLDDQLLMSTPGPVTGKLSAGIRLSPQATMTDFAVEPLNPEGSPDTFETFLEGTWRTTVAYATTSEFSFTREGYLFVASYTSYTDRLVVSTFLCTPNKPPQTRPMILSDKSTMKWLVSDSDGVGFLCPPPRTVSGEPVPTGVQSLWYRMQTTGHVYTTNGTTLELDLHLVLQSLTRTK